MSKNFTSEKGQSFVFVEGEGCFCGKCIFNQMGAEGINLCKENDCNEEGYFILKSDEKD